MRSHLTIRGLPPDVARELERVRRSSGESLNATVIALLRRALGLGVERRSDNGLGDLAGGWDDEALASFERATAPFEQVDDELWR